jgi:hypothetical protein
MPQNILADDMYHSVSRRYRHVTLLACVSVAEDVLMPMIISESPVRDSLWTKSLHQDEDVMVRQRNPAYVNKKIFLFLFRIYGQCIHSVRGKRSLKAEVRE